MDVHQTGPIILGIEWDVEVVVGRLLTRVYGFHTMDFAHIHVFIKIKGILNTVLGNALHVALDNTGLTVCVMNVNLDIIVYLNNDISVQQGHSTQISPVVVLLAVLHVPQEVIPYLEAVPV